jgi:hypothetical protein
MSEDEVMFYQKATLLRKWARKGKQPQVKTTPGRVKTALFWIGQLNHRETHYGEQ